MQASIALRLVDIGSPISLIVLWVVLGAVFFALVRKLRRDDELDTGHGL